jgi:hypothetical protein
MLIVKVVCPPLPLQVYIACLAWLNDVTALGVVGKPLEFFSHLVSCPLRQVKFIQYNVDRPFLSKKRQGKTQRNSKMGEKTCKRVVAMIRLLKPLS